MKCIIWIIFIFSQIVLDSYASETFVISKITSGGFDYNKSLENKLFPSEVVEVIRKNGNKVLVKRLYAQPSWETKSEQENEYSMKPTWINGSDIASINDFEKLTSWPGGSTQGWCDGSCDSGTDFELKKDGVFFAVFEVGGGGPGENPQPVKWSGHLYRHENIIWARPIGKNGNTFERESLFYLKENWELCTYVECFGSI